MKPADIALAVLVAVIWGLAFIASRIGLDSFSPSQLAALRFIVAASPALVLGRPPVAWPMLAAAGLTLFTGQFLFQFFGITHGMPVGLAAIVVHTQAFFTILFAAIVLSERPTGRQLAGIAAALAGLMLIATTVGQDLTALGLGLTTLSAVSWAIGNVLLKRLPPVQMLNLMVWLSLVPPLPSLAISLYADGPADMARAVVAAPWQGVAAVLYLGVISTVFSFAVWGRLLNRYSAATVAPFSLLVPFVAALAASHVFGERFGALRVAGMALVVLGLAVIALPMDRLLAGRAHRGLRPAPASAADMPGVVALIGRVFAEYSFVYDPAVEVPDLLDFAAHYAPPRGAFFVVRQEGRIVGSVGVARLDERTAELHRLYLDAEMRGRGSGQALVAVVMDWCRAQAVSRLVLWSDTRFERAHQLYRRLGFRQHGERTLPDDLNQTRELGFERAL